MRQLKIDLIAPFWFFKYSIPEMKKVGGGTFVNISSLNAMRPVPGLPSYAAAKAGLEALSRSVAVDYADSRSAEHTSELQSLMRISYAVFCLQKKSAAPATAQRRPRL